MHVDSAGMHAGGAGSELVEGDQLIGTGGVEGYEGWSGAAAILEFVPQEARTRLKDVRRMVFEIHDERNTKGTACIHQPPKIRVHPRGNRIRRRRTVLIASCVGLSRMYVGGFGGNREGTVRGAD